MNLQQLKYVKALVEEGSFVGAANRCGVTQPTLSNGITQLEVEMGGRLFRRTTRSVRMTPYGEQLLPHVIDVLAAFDQLIALSKSAAQKSAPVQVGISPLIGIRRAEEILSRFRGKHPDVEVVYRESNFRVLHDLLRRRLIDLVITPYDPAVSVDADFVRLSLESDHLAFVPMAADRAKWASVDSVSPSDIAQETFVLVPDGCGLACATRRMFESNSLALRRYAGEASSYSAVLEWADLNLGSGILPMSKIPSDMTCAIPVLENGHPVAIEYYVLGKPSTISPELFSQLWDSLLEAKIMLKQGSPSPATYEAPPNHADAPQDSNIRVLRRRTSPAS